MSGPVDAARPTTPLPGAVPTPAPVATPPATPTPEAAPAVSTPPTDQSAVAARGSAPVLSLFDDHQDRISQASEVRDVSEWPSSWPEVLDNAHQANLQVEEARQQLVDLNSDDLAAQNIRTPQILAGMDPGTLAQHIQALLGGWTSDRDADAIMVAMRFAALSGKMGDTLRLLGPDAATLTSKLNAERLAELRGLAQRADCGVTPAQLAALRQR